VTIGQTLLYTLPTVSDFNGNPITITAIENSTKLLPAFSTFTDASNTVLQFSPTLASEVGEFVFIVNASDTWDSNVKNFKVTVYRPAPIFASALSNQTVSLCSSTTYNLPSIVSYFPATVSAVEKTFTTLPGFVSFTDTSNTALLINPVSASESGTKDITITLYDGVKSSTYSLRIVVSANTAPSFSTALSSTVNVNLCSSVT
jgi:hypothetical protein